MKSILFTLLTFLFNLSSNCPSLVTATAFGIPSKLQASETNCPLTQSQIQSLLIGF